MKIDQVDLNEPIQEVVALAQPRQVRAITRWILGLAAYLVERQLNITRSDRDDDSDLGDNPSHILIGVGEIPLTRVSGIEEMGALVALGEDHCLFRFPGHKAAMLKDPNQVGLAKKAEGDAFNSLEPEPGKEQVHKNPELFSRCEQIQDVGKILFPAEHCISANGLASAYCLEYPEELGLSRAMPVLPVQPGRASRGEEREVQARLLDELIHFVLDRRPHPEAVVA